MTDQLDPRRFAELVHLSAAADKFRAEADKLRVEIAHLKRSNHMAWFFGKLLIAILVIVPGAWFYVENVVMPLFTQQLRSEQVRALQSQVEAVKAQMTSTANDLKVTQQRSVDEARLANLQRELQGKGEQLSAAVQAAASRDAELTARQDAVNEKENALAMREAAATNRISELESAESQLRTTIDELRGAEIQLRSRAEAADAVRRIPYDVRDAVARANKATNQAPTSEAVDAVRKATLAAVSSWPLREHQAWVLAASFSPDGTRLATASRDGTAILWNGKLYQPLASARHDDAVVHVEFDPSGTYFVTASWDGDVSLWSANDGKRVRRYKGHRGHKVARARFDSAGARVCSCDHDGGVHVWDVTTAEAIAVFHRGNGATADAFFFSGGDEVIAGGGDGDGGNVVRWNIASRRQVDLTDRYPGWVTRLTVNDRVNAYGAVGGGVSRAVAVETPGTLRVHEWNDNAISSVTVATSRSRSRSPDRAITTYADGRSLIHSLATPKAEVVAAMAGHAGGVMDLCLSGCGRFAFTASSDRTARIWYLTDDEGGEVGMETGTLSGHVGAISALAFHEPTMRLVTCGDDRSARVFALEHVLESRTEVVQRAAQPAKDGPAQEGR